MYAGQNVLRYVEQTVKRYAPLTAELYVLLIAVCVVRSCVGKMVPEPYGG